MTRTDYLYKLIGIQDSLLPLALHDKEKEKEFEFVSNMINYLIKLDKEEQDVSAEKMKEKTEAALYKKNKDQIEDILRFIRERAEQGDSFIYCDEINWYVKEWLVERGYRVYRGNDDVKISWRN